MIEASYVSPSMTAGALELDVGTTWETDGAAESFVVSSSVSARADEAPDTAFGRIVTVIVRIPSPEIRSFI